MTKKRIKYKKIEPFSEKLIKTDEECYIDYNYIIDNIAKKNKTKKKLQPKF